jgi:ribosome maturation factor RimP
MGDRAADKLYGELAPVVAALGLDLVDVEVSVATVRVTVDRDGGVDLDALAGANRAVSSTLDRIDPMPGRYTLEVSSPGVERRLRTPAHFARAVGETVSLRLVADPDDVPGAGAVRRVHGVLVSAGAAGVVLEGAEVPGGSLAVAYDRIERARTVFEWGAKPAPSPGRAKGGKRERVRTP